MVLATSHVGWRGKPDGKTEIKRPRAGFCWINVHLENNEEKQEIKREDIINIKIDDAYICLKKSMFKLVRLVELKVREWNFRTQRSKSFLKEGINKRLAMWSKAQTTCSLIIRNLKLRNSVSTASNFWGKIILNIESYAYPNDWV